MHLLDTNTCIYAIRKRPAEVLDRLSRLGDAQVAVSVITAMELEVGALRSESRLYPGAVRAFLATIVVLPLEDSARVHYGTVRVDLGRKCERIGAHDMLIAAHALALDAILVTNNEREFRRVKGLRVENWVR